MPDSPNAEELRAVYDLLNAQEAAYRRSRTGGRPSYRWNNLDDRLRDSFPGLVHDEMQYGWENQYPKWDAPVRTDRIPRSTPLRPVIQPGAGGVRGEVDPYQYRGPTRLAMEPGKWLSERNPDAQFYGDAAGNVPSAGIGMLAQTLGTPADLVYMAADLLRNPPLQMQGADRPLSTEWFRKNWGYGDDPSAQIASRIPIGPESIAKKVPGLAILAGARARLAPHKLFKDRNDFAIEQLRAGREYNKQHAWNEFKNELGAEGNPRWEIPDDPSRLDVGYMENLIRRSEMSSTREPKGTLMDQVLNHPELYENYPSLRNTPVFFHHDPKLGKVVQGDFSRNQYGTAGHIGEPSKGLINIYADRPAPVDIQDVLLHELQHNVQFLEGHPRGGNARDVLSGMSEREIQNLIKSMQARQSAASSAGVSARELSERDLANEAYRRLAGEVEARNVQARWRDPALMQWAPSITEDVPRLLQRKIY